MAENKEIRNARNTVYFTPILMKKVNAWCRMKNMTFTGYVTGIVETEISSREDEINAFLELTENDSQPEPLKPCPFCGSKAKLYEAYDSSFSVQCEICGNRTLTYRTPEEARQKWNNRPESQT